MIKFTVNSLIVKYVMTIALSLYILNGCGWIAATAVAGAAAGVVLTAGSVSDIDKTEKAIAVEKLIYAFESNNGIITDLSFMDGYVEGCVDNYTVKAHIYTRRDGILDINVRATRYLISNSKIAHKVINKYRNYIR